MEGLFTLIFYIGLFLLVRSVSQKKKAKQKKGPAAGPDSARPASPRARQTAPARKAPEKRQTAAPRAGTTATRRSSMPAEAFGSTEKQSPRRAPEAASPAPQGGSGLGHTVRPAFAGGHAHQETSMTGFGECPPEQEVHAGKTDRSAPDAPSFEEERPSLVPGFTAAETMRAVIFSEILSKPKALR